MILLKPKFILPLALAAGILATLGVYRYLEKQKEDLSKPKIPLVQVVVAKKPLPIGTVLNEEVVEVKDWPQDIVPRGTFASINDLSDRVIKAEIEHGEPVLASRLAPVGSAGGFSSLIPPGMRAQTVSVDITSGVSGFILPNTRVDVLVTVPSPHRKEESTTKIILQDILVLAVDQTFQREDDDPITSQSVTLLVSPDQAEKLALASSEGKLQLILRNTADKDDGSTSGVKLKELIARPRPRVIRQIVRVPAEPESQQEEPQERVVEVLKSNERSEVTFELSGDKK